MTRKCHVPFWRAVALARESLTLIHNAAVNILKRALGTVGHTVTSVLDQNACGELSSTRTGSGLVGQDSSVKQESPSMQERGVSSQHIQGVVKTSWF